MDVSSLLELPGVEDVITTSHALYVLCNNKDTPPIYSDKRVVKLLAGEILSHPDLLVMLQGESMKTGVLRHQFSKKILYEYSLSALNAQEKQTISHTLAGTGGRKSMLLALGGTRLGRGVVLLPAERENELDLFFDQHSVTYTKQMVYSEEEHAF